MIDPDDKFLMDFHANGKEKGLKILDAGVTVTTPQGTVPLEEYGSFQPQFVPMFNRGEVMGWNMVSNLGNGDKILGDWNLEHKGSLTSLCRNISARVSAGKIKVGDETKAEKDLKATWQGYADRLKNEQMHPNELSVEFSAVSQTGPEVDNFAKKFYFHEFTEEEKKTWVDSGKESDRRFIEEMENAFHVPQVYIDSMSQYDPETREVIVHKPRAMGKTMPITTNKQLLGRLKRNIPQSCVDSVIMTTDNWVEQAEVEMEVAKKIVNPKHQIRYKMSLPSLEAINANIADAWGRFIFAKRSRENVLKNHLAELKRMSDHELRVYINLARMRANTISGGKKFPSQLDMEKYVMALEEQDDRRREHYNKL